MCRSTIESIALDRDGRPRPEGRVPLASRRFRHRAGRMAHDPLLAVDPARLSLEERDLAAAWQELATLRLQVGAQQPADPDLAFAERLSAAGIASDGEGRALWHGILAWANTRVPRAALYEEVGVAFAAARSRWPDVELPRPTALMFRALDYARRPGWLAVARSGDARAQYDRFLWRAGLIAWARASNEAVNYHTTGDLRAPLLVALDVAGPDEDAIAAVVFDGEPLPVASWADALARMADLRVLACDPFLELVRRFHAAPPMTDPGDVLSEWERAMGPAADGFQTAWRRAAVRDAALRLVRRLQRHGRLLRETADPHVFEDLVAAAEGQPFRLRSYFARPDILHAYDALRDIVTQARHEDDASPSPPAAPAPGDDDVHELAVAAAWRYALRLLARERRLGWMVAAPLVDRHWERFRGEFLDLLVTHQAGSDEEEDAICRAIRHPERAAFCCDAFIERLSRSRAVVSIAPFLVAALSRLGGDELESRLPRLSQLVLARRNSANALFADLIPFWRRAGNPLQALHFSLRYHERARDGGGEALLAAIRFAGEVEDFDRGGARVLDVLRAADRVEPVVWSRMLDLGQARGRRTDVWDAMLSWAGRPVDASGREKPRERLAEQWGLVLEVATAGAWEPWAQLSAVAQTTGCPVPAVWARLVAVANENGFAYVARESAKRFVASWGSDPAITAALWAALDEEARGRADPDELVDLMHWLHLDLGHNAWMAESEFAARLLAVPNLTVRMLVEWASRRTISARRWAALGRALAARGAELEGILRLVADSGAPVARAVEGLLGVLPDARAWPALLRLLAGPARAVDWAWLEALERWKVAPEDRAPQLFSILNHLPRPPAVSSPEIDGELHVLLAHLLDRTPPSGWRYVTAHFRKVRRGSREWMVRLEQLEYQAFTRGR